MQLVHIFNLSDAKSRRHILSIYSLLIIFNLLAWVWAFIAFRNYPILLGTALLAYSFGLRHAVDADHIAAIDNVTRKLMQDKQRPITVGLFFSLGHSSVVILVCAAIALAAVSLQGRFSQFREVGALVGTSVSALFLFAIALMNLIILRSIYQAWQKVKRGEPVIDEDFDLLLANRGFLARVFRPLFRMITRAWHMYPLGVLFGLGFDTATEIALLGLSATQIAQGLSSWTIMVFPVLFCAGMSLVDTLDSHLMLGAYGWAYMKPVRKIYYNMIITLMSVVVAVVVGGVEVLGMMAERLNLQGAVWDAINVLNEHFGVLGFLIVGIFVVSWVISVLVYRFRHFDTMPEKSTSVSR